MWRGNLFLKSSDNKTSTPKLNKCNDRLFERLLVEFHACPTCKPFSTLDFIFG